ncbi:ATP-binding cassette domain-containing protein [Sulfitobacter mediterraneus]|uniref:ABC transporter ATP-binding protein n=1 Tax=Sulfitobacter TaxID=60136 RepID=UPI0019342B92|nr:MULTISPECIES: ATP-binding cassette domain-containing protein [Sulfitobacter]MBM1634928.1 ATP-binding cassette domain-containing protein [Sulfitobacter mediterraneus]MBM1642783.1 ATP-binding cassette domain-containing protein [Sulfitobacter mediterraneus]MBM1646831.1 ATP-binding cassette domain-containing protein [Sulfitobacter mediterraneus]MBM1650841.1 ATP-binding cassette domain-containing protein [Sulfitobacter mediterraneus]MBM1654899.1 ATP-binding cassette domain-containing protein [Su
MAETVLETHGLTMRFGGVTASDNVNFSLKARELRCLIGPNGAGKSTFFKCVTGLLTPTEGQVFMRGQDVTGWQPHQIASLGVGIKTQTPNVMDALNVHENIWLSARRFHDAAEAKARTDTIIDRLALGAIARTELGQLAHGERQRVELGLVAVADPWLVLLDEPAAGMSAQDVDRMTEIIHELTRSAAVVIVEHDMQFIRSIAETVTVFHQGAVLMEDHVDRVMSDPTVRAVYLGKKA